MLELQSSKTTRNFSTHLYSIQRNPKYVIRYKEYHIFKP